MGKKPNSSDWMVWSCDMGTELRLWTGKLLVGLILLRQIIPTAWNKNPTALIGGFVCPLPLRCWDNITYRFGIIFLKGYLLYFHLLTPFKVVMTFEKIKHR